MNFKSYEEWEKYFLPEHHERKRRARLTPDELAREDGQRMASELLADLRERLQAEVDRGDHRDEEEV